MQMCEIKPTMPNLPCQTYQVEPTKTNFKKSKPKTKSVTVKSVNAWVRSAFGNVHSAAATSEHKFFDYKLVQSHILFSMIIQYFPIFVNVHQYIFQDWPLPQSCCFLQSSSRAPRDCFEGASKTASFS